jgi:peptide/nickel transport system permease protein
LLRVIFGRLLVAIPTLLVLSLAIFLMVKAIPGDPALIMLGERASPEALAELRHDMGLDRPWSEQYTRFLTRLVFAGDFGRSLRDHALVSDLIKEKFPATAELAVGAMIIACGIGIPMGLLGARYAGTIIDFSSMTIAVFGVSMPIFWLALMLLWIFGVELGWFPLSGRMGIEMTYEPVTGFAIWDSLVAGDWPLLRNSL